MNGSPILIPRVVMNRRQTNSRAPMKVVAIFSRGKWSSGEHARPPSPLVDVKGGPRCEDHAQEEKQSKDKWRTQLSATLGRFFFGGPRFRSRPWTVTLLLNGRPGIPHQEIFRFSEAEPESGMQLQTAKAPSQRPAARRANVFYFPTDRL